MFVDLQKAVNTSRIVPVPEEVVVRQEVAKPVIISNSNDKKDKDTSIALALLSSKLIQELSRIKK